jgi:hypothetical protein
MTVAYNHGIWFNKLIRLNNHVRQEEKEADYGWSSL